MNYEAMTVDELDALSVKLKGEIEAIRDVRREAKAVRDRKVLLESLARKLNIDVSGITPEQAETLLAVARQTPPGPGDVVISPGPGSIDIRMGGVSTAGGQE